MANSDILKSILVLDSLEDLNAHLDKQSADIRCLLLNDLDALVDYEDANEWASAVRLCEALAIVGWGEREQLDAMSRFNGDCWETKFVTDRDDIRFRFGRWSKRKAGWVLRNPEDHTSPDFPDRVKIEWKHYAGINFPIVDREDLPSQRNYRKQLPIRMGLIGGSNPTSSAVIAHKRELESHLREAMQPDDYGEALEFFYLTFSCPALSASKVTGLSIGTFNSKNRAFYSELHFADGFEQLDLCEQREFVATNLQAAVSALESRLKKRKIDYAISAFKDDVNTAVTAWLRVHDS